LRPGRPFTNANSHCDGNGYGYCNGDTDIYTRTAGYTVAKAASDSAAAAIRSLTSK
jgi:hypothetical protein